MEALRRLVYLKSEGTVPTRATIRRTLYEQVYGVDISREAVRIAAFSLYLAALELDPDPHHDGDMKFQPLVNYTLRVGNALDIDLGTNKFDLIVGNPPMSFRGRAATRARRMRNPSAPRSPRGESLDFITRAIEFSHDRTRFGVILSATPVSQPKRYRYRCCTQRDRVPCSGDAGQHLGALEMVVSEGQVSPRWHCSHGTESNRRIG